MELPAGAPGAAVDNISYQLGHISGQLSALTAAVASNHRELSKRLDQAEADIADLKQSRAKYVGMATGIASAVSAAVTALTSFVFRS